MKTELFEAINVLGQSTGIIGTYKIILHKFQDCLELISIVPYY